MLGCAADNIRPVNIQSLRMLEKRIFIFAGNVHHRFMLFFRRQHHLVVTLVGIARQVPDISNIHGGPQQYILTTPSELEGTRGSTWRLYVLYNFNVIVVVLKIVLNHWNF